MRAPNQPNEPIALNINPETVGFIIIKAREFDAKVEPVEPDPGSNPADDDEREILEDYADDPTLEELRGAIDSLDDDEVIDLIALAWVGRGDFDVAEWPQALAQARATRDAHATDYLIGTPLLADYLQEALAALGYSLEDFEKDRL